MSVVSGVRFFGFLLLASFCGLCGAASLTEDLLRAKTQGLVLYGQYKYISAQPYLREAAQAGDREAQYYLGESISAQKRYVTDEAHKWYVAAADQGDYYAMYRLASRKNNLCEVMDNCPSDSRSPEEWYQLARRTTEKLALQGDGEAMYVRAMLGGDISWLERSVASGYPEAQYRMAIMYKEGAKFYFPPWKKGKEIEGLLKSAAESGHVRAMDYYIEILQERGDIAEARKLLEAAALRGDANAVGAYGVYTSHTPDGMGFALDLVKGYGLVLTLRELDGGGGMQVYVEDKLKEIGEKMTGEQIKEASIFAEKWKLSHPPLSFFQQKLSF